MKIISRFKDYYDYIPQCYGGPDPKVVYVRKNLKEPEDIGFGTTIDHGLKVVVKTDLIQPSSYRFHKDDSLHFKLLVVAGKVFAIYADMSVSNVVKYKLVDDLNQDEIGRYFAKKYNFYARGSHLTYDEAVRGVFREDMLQLCKTLKAPVFTIRSFERIRNNSDGKSIVTIDGVVPNLSEFRLANVYPAEQIYQDISYFMGNLINDSPDLAPPVKISDKDRIIQYGFDLKSSFRHPVK